MLIGNKKVSQLTPLAPSDVAANDLFLIIDSSVRESKNISAADLTAWLNGSGSIFAQHSVTADTASYILGSNVKGPVVLATNAGSAISSSWANRSGHADNADSSSTATTASFALNASGLSNTSSYLQYSGFPNGTASYALESQVADTVLTAAFLLYFGGDNGTASYAIFALSTSFCDTANTASYFNNAAGTVASASEAIHSQTADLALLSNTASYLNYDGVNSTGTASYALVAGQVGPNTMFAYGMAEAQYQSISASSLDNLTVRPSQFAQHRTLIEAIGTVILNFTASGQNEYSLSLNRLNRLNGEYVIMDQEVVALDTTPILNTWGSNATGSLKLPFSLLKQDELNGEYLVQVTSSSPYLQIDTTRNVRFIVTSASDFVDIFLDQPIELDIQPSESVLITFTSSATPTQVTYDFLPGLLTTGSNTITSIDISNQGVTSVKYIWKCVPLNYFNCANNSIAELKYFFPGPLQTLICNNNTLGFVADLNNTTASYIDISHNGITVLPLLSPSTSYFDCSYNPITLLPDPMPPELQALGAGGTFISGITPVLPDSLQSASFVNTNLAGLFNLPISMSALNLYNTLVATMSMDLPPSMSYLDVSYAHFDVTGLENMTTNLVDSGVISGNFAMLGYGPPTTTTLINNILSLITNGWTVTYDI